ncbi:MAG TPA: hypothetical protein DEP82_10115 [Arthrobacter bacterium]|jgi:hypothetical protein|nr:hypothetical protein [Arthrobacter sp.]
MPRKPTISSDDQGTSGEFLARAFVVTDRLSAAYAEMAADSHREAEAEEWLTAVSVDMPLDDAWLSVCL